MDEDWRNTFGILMCTEICDGSGTGICNGAPSTCSSRFCHGLANSVILHEENEDSMSEITTIV